MLSVSPLAPDLLAAGEDYAAFRARATQNEERFDFAFDHPVHGDDDLALLRRLPALTVVAIGADWCPDVYFTLPTWAQVCDALDGWSLRVFERDEHPDLMAAFLWLGKAQRVPVYAFYDDAGRLQAWWSGRSAEAQQAFDGWLGGGTYADLSGERKKEVGARLIAGYETRFRRANFDEILDLLRAAFHLGRREG